MMSDPAPATCTAFEGSRLLLAGPLVEVALAMKAAAERGTADPVLIFDDATGHALDFDLRGTKADVIERLPRSEPSHERRGRGRPKLGVVGREVTLLPRHWEWLAAQPGGASVALRKLVDEARRTGGTTQASRVAREAAYRFMSAMAGNLPGFEEAARALFANDRPRFEQHISDWPDDIRSYAVRLASPPQEVAAS